jgi:hypothetical protein
LIKFGEEIDDGEWRAGFELDAANLRRARGYL